MFGRGFLAKGGGVWLGWGWHAQAGPLKKEELGLKPHRGPHCLVHRGILDSVLTWSGLTQVQRIFGVVVAFSPPVFLYGKKVSLGQ